MQASFEYQFFVNILANIVFNNGEFCWLNTFDGDSDVNDNGNKTNTESQQAASLSITHSSEAIGTILKAIVHII